MIFAATGHRPVHFYRTYDYDRLTEFAARYLQTYGVTMAISGMARGWDLAIAEAAIRLGIPLIAAVPFAGQEDRWTDAPRDQALYHRLLLAAAEVVVISPRRDSEAYRTRDYWMVDHAAAVLALYSGKPSGTRITVEYAERRDRPVLNLWPAWLRYCEPLAT